MTNGIPHLISRFHIFYSKYTWLG